MIFIRLVELLDEIPMSQHELNRLTGVRQATINDMCQNKTKRLSLDNLAKICIALNCEITDILELKKN